MRGPILTPRWVGSLVSLASLVLVFVPVWTLSQCATIDGRARDLAARTEGIAGPEDLILAGLPRADPGRSRGRLLFPFRPLFAVDADTVDMDLPTLPFRRVLAVGDLDPERLKLGPASRIVDTVRLFELGDPGRLLLSLVDYTRIEIRGVQGTRSCRVAHPSGGVACGSEAWFHIGPRVQRVGGRDRLCLWAHPPPDGAQLAIGLSIAPGTAAPGSRLSVDVQFADEVRHDPLHPEVQVELREEGSVLASTTCDNHKASCQLTGPSGMDRDRRLELVVTTPHNGRQLLCLGGGLVAEAGAPP
ncbi:MAG: hypothetical protein ABIJ09_12160 [Pseudomonadota bacterium]